jgi:hypothetical protein
MATPTCSTRYCRRQHRRSPEMPLKDAAYCPCIRRPVTGIGFGWRAVWPPAYRVLPAPYGRILTNIFYSNLYAVHSGSVCTISQQPHCSDSLLISYSSYMFRRMSSSGSFLLSVLLSYIMLLKTKRRQLYLNPQSVPRSKHFSSHTKHRQLYLKTQYVPRCKHFSSYTKRRPLYLNPVRTVQ